MKHKPQTLTFPVLSVIAAVSAVIAGWKAAPFVSAAVIAQEAAESAEPASTAAADTTATEVLDSVRETLDSLDSLSADLHETVIMSGQRLTAVGRYVQGSGNRIRLEFRLFPVRAVQSSDANHDSITEPPVDTSELKPTASLTQVSDGSILWSLWTNGDLRQLTRRNLREILEAVPESDSYNGTRMLQDLGVGGLQTLLAKLQAVMEFGPVREQQIGDISYLVLTGRWTEASRQNFFNATTPETPLPDFVPDYVRIYIDAQARLPRRIQYLKKHADPSQTLVRPLVTLDFRKLSLNEAIPDETFVFEAPEGVVEENLTPQIIEQIQQLANPQPATEDPAAADPQPDSQP